MGNGKKKTWKQYYDGSITVAAAFIKLGLQTGQSVAIIGFNSPEWFLADLGAIAAGGVACGIYTTNGPDACQYVIEHSEAAIIVTENENQTEKILKIKSRLPLIKKIIQWSGKLVRNDNVISWEALIKLVEGDTSSREEVERRIKDLKPGKCCTLIYTSGTTGPPKGVMVSHDNITWVSKTQLNETGGTEENPVVAVSYLPLSHIAAQILDIHVPMAVAGETWFAQPDALKGSLVNTLKEVRPTHFFGVPRVWEKIQEKMMATGQSGSALRKYIAQWAKAKGLEGSYSMQAGKGTPWGWWLADTVVFSKVKVALGLERCIYAATGAAPTSKETLDYFMSLNIPLHEIYGMSESTGCISINTIDKTRTSTVGVKVVDTEVKLDNKDAEGNGEICFKGRTQFLGYLKSPKETEECFDKDGFIHTGDIGRFDKDGFLSITGRIKELIITAGGENIPPVLIEDELKKQLPIISNVMVVGDRRKFLGCLFTLKCDNNKEAVEGTYQLSDNLSKAVLSQLDSIGSTAKTVKEAISDEKVRTLIQAGVDRYNKIATSGAQRVQKFEILEKDFSLEEGDLTPTLKLKRKVTAKKYEDIINKIYAGSDKE